MKLRVLALLIAVVLGANAQTSALEQAQKHFRRTEYEATLTLLLPQPDKSGAMLQLIGHCYYLEGNFDKAVDYFTKATMAEPNNSRYFNWLGRSWGRKAETSSVFTAPRNAVRARNAFEKAVQLDGSDLDAMEDLFEYYLEAPGFMGGGMDKAESLAERISSLDPVRGHWLRASLAEKRKEYGAAEKQLRLAVEAAPRQAGRLLDLAKFLARRGRYEESEQAFAKAEKAAPHDPKILFEHAEALVSTKRNPDTARRLLEEYIAAPLTPEMPPRYEAEELLKKAEEM